MKLWNIDDTRYDGVIQILKDISKSLHEQTECLKGELKPLIEEHTSISFIIKCDEPKISRDFIKVTFIGEDIIKVETIYHTNTEIKYCNDISEFETLIDKIITSKLCSDMISHYIFLHKKATRL